MSRGEKSDQLRSPERARCPTDGTSFPSGQILQRFALAIPALRCDPVAARPGPLRISPAAVNGRFPALSCVARPHLSHSPHPRPLRRRPSAAGLASGTSDGGATEGDATATGACLCVLCEAHHVCFTVCMRFTGAVGARYLPPTPRIAPGAARLGGPLGCRGGLGGAIGPRRRRRPAADRPDVAVAAQRTGPPAAPRRDPRRPRPGPADGRLCPGSVGPRHAPSVKLTEKGRVAQAAR